MNQYGIQKFPVEDEKIVLKWLRRAIELKMICGSDEVDLDESGHIQEMLYAWYETSK